MGMSAQRHGIKLRHLRRGNSWGRTYGRRFCESQKAAANRNTCWSVLNRSPKSVFETDALCIPLIIG